MNGKKIGGWIVRGGIAAVGCSSMGAGSIGGKNYCGNLLWQSSLTLLPPKGRKELNHGIHEIHEKRRCQPCRTCRTQGGEACHASENKS